MRLHPSKLAVVSIGGVLVGSLAFVLARPGLVDAALAASASQVATTAPLLPVETAPTATTPPSTVSTSTVEAQRGRLVIQGVGDVSFDPDYIAAFASSGFQIAFDGLDGIFTSDDLTVINLECPPTNAGSQLDKEYSFRCDPAALPVAHAAGVDVANLANNHGQDRGVEGLLDSIGNLRTAGIAPVGVGANLSEAMEPALFDINGWTVAVLGMGGVIPGDGWLATEGSPGMADGDNVEQMAAAVAAAAQRADVVVVTIHWGRELVAEPDDGDRDRAREMVNAGADIIFGHHPHRLGEMEMIGETPVFWTLGNFIWPRLSDLGATTAVGRVVIEPDGSVLACLVPVFIERSGQPELTADQYCRAEQ